MSNLFINKKIGLYDHAVFVNGKKDYYADSSLSFTAYIKSVYKHYNIAYGKFFKMDPLSKLGFVSSEILLLENSTINNIKPEQVSLIFANKSASLVTDKKYQQTISEIPSPAVFVYTLPNIVIGEICIKNKFRGESLFFVQEEFDKPFMVEYIKTLFLTTGTKACITGWVEIDTNLNYRSELYLVSETDQGWEFNEPNMRVEP